MKTKTAYIITIKGGKEVRVTAGSSREACGNLRKRQPAVEIIGVRLGGYDRS